MTVSLLLSIVLGYVGVSNRCYRQQRTVTTDDSKGHGMNRSIILPG